MGLALQFTAAMVVGLCYYLLAMAMTVYDGVLSLIFQPIAGAVLTAIAIGLMWLIGLPIRMSESINAWWRNHWWISFILGTLAFFMMCASWLPALRSQVWNPDLEIFEVGFHPLLAPGGWLLTIFAVLHFFPPLSILMWKSKCSSGHT